MILQHASSTTTGKGWVCLYCQLGGVKGSAWEPRGQWWLYTRHLTQGHSQERQASLSLHPRATMTTLEYFFEYVISTDCFHPFKATFEFVQSPTRLSQRLMTQIASIKYVFLFAHTENKGWSLNTPGGLQPCLLLSCSEFWPCLYLETMPTYSIDDSWLGTEFAQVCMKCIKNGEESRLLKAALSNLEAADDVFKNNSSKTCFSFCRDRDMPSHQVEDSY